MIRLSLIHISFVYLPDTVFKEIYDAPTLLTYGFNVDEALQPQMEEFLSSYVSENSSVAYTSTKLLKEQLDSVRSMILVIGGLIGCIMAFAGLINFTNMIITNIITRRQDVYKRQLRHLLKKISSAVPLFYQTSLIPSRIRTGSRSSASRLTVSCASLNRLCPVRTFCDILLKTRRSKIHTAILNILHIRDQAVVTSGIQRCDADS